MREVKDTCLACYELSRKHFSSMSRNPMQRPWKKFVPLNQLKQIIRQGKEDEVTKTFKRLDDKEKVEMVDYLA